MPVGALVAPHRHTHEDEYSIVTGGEIGFRSEDVVLGPGGCITKPATMIEIISPAGLEHFFREVAEMVAAGPPYPPSAADLVDRHGLIFEQPDWLADVVDRYGLAVDSLTTRPAADPGPACAELDPGQV